MVKEGQGTGRLLGGLAGILTSPVSWLLLGLPVMGFYSGRLLRQWVDRPVPSQDRLLRAIMTTEALERELALRRKQLERLGEPLD